MKRTTLIIAAVAISFATGCRKNASEPESPDAVDGDGPMERAGEWTDEAAEDAGDGMEEAAEETKETADEVADDLDGDPATD